MSPKRNELVEHWLDLLQPLGEVRARAMFGGHGIYLDDVMFGLVADDTLYFKVDALNEETFERAGLPPFVFTKKDGGTMTMSYRQAPSAALDNGDELCEWGRLGVEASLRATQSKLAAQRRRTQKKTASAKAAASKAATKKAAKNPTKKAASAK